MFGEEEASVAENILAESRKDVEQRVKNAIAAHARVFQDKPSEEQREAHTSAKEIGSQLAFQRHHRVICPACGGPATVQGTAFGKERATHDAGEIVVRQAVSPTVFECSSCGLKLHGYAELEAAGLGGHYTRRTKYAPADFFGLYTQDELEERLAEFVGGEEGEEYDNE